MQWGSLGFGLVVGGALTAAAGCACAQRDGGAAATRKPAEDEVHLVEAGCAACIFHMMDESGCTLAVRIDGRPRLVRGSDLDDHGDAHAPDGMCMTARQARVVGRVEDGVFVAERFELLPADGKR